ncbi:carotenoid oxygenase family protein [Sphingomonas sp. R86521]|uniref:8'-apo-carotenoid 13,14-cleaving dioxygenase n=1 Tax=Sphingomonas sp. R86521 TaxID=3093860 RepID=UPI0036D42659
MASVLVRIDDEEGDEAQRTTHRFLSGIHRPLTEELTLTELKVRGTIPPALSGRYLRTGPNPVAPDPASYHWFTGDGMVHGLAIRDGKALWYRNRWIGSRRNAAARGVAPAPGPRRGSSDTVNTNVVDLGGRVFAVVEGGSYPVELSETLDDQRYDDFGGSLTGSFTAHPHRDPLTGEHHGICYDGQRPNEIRHVVLDASGTVVREAPIAVEHGPMIHDCAITARYVVILDLPVTFSLATHLAGGPLPYAWNPAHRARVGLMPRGGDQDAIIWCDVDPAYVFHVANAFDLPDGRVVVDVCAYPTMFDGTPGGPDATSRGLERWTLDPATGMTVIRTIDATPQEFPRIDERRSGQRHRYAYVMATQSDRRFQSASQLYKHDLVEGSRAVHDFGIDRHPGEFVFVPAYDNAGEDEGWLIGFVIDAASDTTELVILDAHKFEGAPVATVRLPHRIPPGFHGNWINGGPAS